MRAISLRDSGRYADVLLCPESDAERVRCTDALALDEPVTFAVHGVLVGNITGVVMRRASIYVEMRIARPPSAVMRDHTIRQPS